jgi:hypothetical protein
MKTASSEHGLCAVWVYSHVCVCECLSAVVPSIGRSVRYCQLLCSQSLLRADSRQKEAV